jgi:hypothetical protein
MSEPKNTESEVKVTREVTPLRKHFGRRMLAWSAKFARLTVYFMFVGILLAVVAGRMAYAHAKKAAMETGDELLRLTDAAHMSGVYRLRLNGELVRVTSAVSNTDHNVILDRFQKECEEHADGMEMEFARLSDAITPNANPRNEGHPGIGILRNSDDKGGMVACFAIGKVKDTGEVYKRIGEFAKSGDLGALGNIRYVAAKKGDTTTSHVVALWTEGSFDVKKMFPDEGDAPGNDAPGVLRPPSSKRLMTAYAEGAPYGVRVYDSSWTKEAILAEYDKVMPATGWMTFPRATEAAPFSRAFSKEGHDIIVTAEPSQNGTGTSISIVEMGSP